MSGNRKPGRARRPALSAAQIRGAPQSGRILPLKTCCRLELMCAFPPPKQTRCRTLVFLVTQGNTTYRLQSVAQHTGPDKRRCASFASGRMAGKGREPPSEGATKCLI